MSKLKTKKLALIRISLLVLNKLCLYCYSNSNCHRDNRASLEMLYARLAAHQPPDTNQPTSDLLMPLRVSVERQAM